MKFNVMKAYLLIFVSFISLVSSQNQAGERFGNSLTAYGSQAPPGARPFQVYLQHSLHSCGGVIISPNWIVTAAHCTQDPNVYAYMIRAGSLNKLSGGYVHYADRIIRHPQYNLRGLTENDIALIHVTQPFQLNGYSINKIEMFNKNEMAQSESIATLSGWGMIEDGHSPDMLQMAYVPVQPKSRCRRIYNYYRWTLSEGQICAGYTTEGSNSCRGDSGGPLTIDNRLIGIVSWGSQRCGRVNALTAPAVPSAYTEIAHFREWIRHHTGV